jgi:multiple sugar transport system substrate-binding protein
MVKKSMALFFTLLLIVGFLGGCGKGEGEGEREKVSNDPQKNKVVSTEPVTLQLLQSNIALTDEDFQKFIAEPVNKKIPNITIEMIRVTKEVTPESLIASGSFPDLVYTGSNSIDRFDQLGIPTDLAELVKINQFDLGKFDGTVLKFVKSTSAKGNLLAFPFSDKFSTLFYNKDIFDKFAVPYPKDGMNWEETIELAKRLTRTVDKIQYKGLAEPGERNFASIMKIPYFDPKTKKAVINTDKWKKVFELNQQVLAIPGNQIPQGKDREMFTKDQTLAMLAQSTQRIGEFDVLYNQGSKLNWDMAAYPNLKGYPGLVSAPNPVVIMIFQLSKHKDAAFQALSVVTSEENQMNMSQNGTFSILKDQKIKDSYGTQLKSLQGKNVKGVFKNKFSEGSPLSPYDNLIRKHITNALDQVYSGEKDINTALRDAEEAANKELASEMGK